MKFKHLSLFLLVVFFMAAGMLAACSTGEDKPNIKVTVLLQDLTQEEYRQVGSGEIHNPVIDDFKKLTVRLDTLGFAERQISFPTLLDLQDLLTADVYWFGSSESRDNASEDEAYYLVESTLYTGNTSLEELRDKLSVLAIGVSYTDKLGNKTESIYNLDDYFTIKSGSDSPKQADPNKNEELDSLIAGIFPETAVREKGVLLLTKLIPRSVVKEDDLLLALVLNEAKIGQSGATLLVLDKSFDVIESSVGEVPLSPCYTAQTFRTSGYTITFGRTDNTKWLGDTDQVVSVDLQKVKAVYDDGSEVWSPVQNNSYICWVKGTTDLAGLYFYNNKNELQADSTEIWGRGLGRIGLENYILSPENVVKSCLEAKKNNNYMAWKALLWPIVKNEQNLTATFEKPGDLGVVTLSIEKITVDEEKTKNLKSRSVEASWQKSITGRMLISKKTSSWFPPVIRWITTTPRFPIRKGICFRILSWCGSIKTPLG